MKNNIKNKNIKKYKCPECGLIYNTKELAQSCEKWCQEHKSCNLAITKNAINKNTIIHINNN